MNGSHTQGSGGQGELTGPQIGRAIRYLRQSSGLTQQDLARAAHILGGTGYVSRLENGEYRNLSYDTLDRLATALGLTNASALYDRITSITNESRSRGPQPLPRLSPEAEAIRARANKLERFIAETEKIMTEMPDAYREPARRAALAVMRGFRSASATDRETAEGGAEVRGESGVLVG